MKKGQGDQRSMKNARGSSKTSFTFQTERKLSKQVGAMLQNVEVVETPEIGRKASMKQQLFGGSLYSKALLRGLDKSAETTLTLNEALRFLQGTQHLFFKKCKTFPPELSTFNPKSKRGIWNSSGRVVYYTGEKARTCCSYCLYSSFTQEVVDYKGNTVIVSRGWQMIFGVNSQVEIRLGDGKLLGSMHQSCLDSTYLIKDGSGRLIYKIQAPCFAPCAPFVFWCFHEHFEICMDDGVTEIGRITNHWDDDIGVHEFQSCVGIEMNRVDDIRVKALLLGCYFLIEFQYYRRGGNGFYYLFLILLFVAIIVLWTNCVGYCPDWKHLLHLDKLGIGIAL